MTTEAPKTRLRAPQRRELIVEAALRPSSRSAATRPPRSGGSPAPPASHAPCSTTTSRPSTRCSWRCLDVEQEALLAYLRRRRSAPQGTTEERWRATFDAFFTFVEEQPARLAAAVPEPPAAEPRGRTGIPADPGGVQPGARETCSRPTTHGAPASSPRPFARERCSRSIATALTAAARWWQSHPESAGQRWSTPRWRRCGPASAACSLPTPKLLRVDAPARISDIPEVIARMRAIDASLPRRGRRGNLQPPVPPGDARGRLGQLGHRVREPQVHQGLDVVFARHTSTRGDDGSGGARPPA